MKVGSTLSEDAYKFDGKLSLKQAIPLGLQHVMAKKLLWIWSD